MDFTLNRTWPIFYDYIPMYKFQSNTSILSKDIARKLFFKVENFSKLKKGHGRTGRTYVRTGRDGRDGRTYGQW